MENEVVKRVVSQQKQKWIVLFQKISRLPSQKGLEFPGKRGIGGFKDPII